MLSLFQEIIACLQGNTITLGDKNILLHRVVVRELSREFEVIAEVVVPAQYISPSHKASISFSISKACIESARHVSPYIRAAVTEGLRRAMTEYLGRGPAYFKPSLLHNPHLESPSSSTPRPTTPLTAEQLKEFLKIIRVTPEIRLQGGNLIITNQISIDLPDGSTIESTSDESWVDISYLKE